MEAQGKGSVLLTSSIIEPPIAVLISPRVGGVLPAASNSNVSASAKYQHAAENLKSCDFSMCVAFTAPFAVDHG